MTSSVEGIDIAGVLGFKDNLVAGKFKGLQGLIKANGIAVIEGAGRLVAPNTVRVGADDIIGTNIVLATVSYSRSLPGLELGGRVIASAHALELQEVPKRVAILGGGVIGVEFASVWLSFGAEVTIIEGLPHLVPVSYTHLDVYKRQLQHRVVSGEAERLGRAHRAAPPLSRSNRLLTF